MKINNPLSLCLFLGLCTLCGCTPLTSSPDEEKHQAELNFHVLQTNLDDLRHDLNRFQTELSISDDKIRYQEKSLSTLKEKECKQLIQSIQKLCLQMEEKQEDILALKEEQKNANQRLADLDQHATNVVRALIQYKKKLVEMERQVAEQNQKFAEIAHLRLNLDKAMAHLQKPTSFRKYTIKAGDTLQTIAKTQNTTAEQLRQINGITKKDTLVIGQEIKIPK